MPHMCKLKNNSSLSFISVAKKRYKRILKWTILSHKHPKTRLLYRSSNDIEKEIIKHMKSKSYLIIHPFSLFRLFWEFYMFWVFIFALIILPLNIVKHKIPRDDNNYFLGILGIFTLLIDLLCFIDMFITFQTGFYNGRQIILDKKKIKNNYLLSSYFVTDLLSSLPIELWDMVFSLTLDRSTYVIHYSIIVHMHLLALLKLSRIKTLINYGEIVYYIFKMSETTQVIGKLINVVIVFTHWFACLNFIIPSYIYTTMSQHYTWIWTIFDRVPTLLELYHACFFRAISILTCTFSDEFKERNNMEGIIASFGLIISTILSGVILIFVVSIVLNKSSTVINYTIYKGQVKKYMIGKDLKSDLQTRVLEFIDYTYGGLYFNEKVVNDILSQKLLQEIAIYRGQKLLQDTILMRLPLIHMNYVLCHMKEEMYTPNDTIIKSGTKGNCMYFIASGTVAIKSPAGKEICHLQIGEYFGEISLVFKGQRRTADVQALEHCCLFRLDRKIFQSRISTHENIMHDMRVKASERIAITERMNALHLQLLTELQNIKTLDNDEY